MKPLILIIILGTVIQVSLPFPSPPLDPGADITVAESVGFRHALDSAKPGDRIFLPKSIYPGSFLAKANGTEEHPIEIIGISRTLILGERKHPALSITGNHWKISNLNISNEGNIALLVTGDHFLGVGLKILKADAGVQLQGELNQLWNSTIANVKTGLVLEGTRNVAVNSNKIFNATTSCIFVSKTSVNGIMDENECGQGSRIVNEGGVLEKNTIYLKNN